MKHENLSLLFIPNKSILYFLGSFQETKTCIHIYFCFFLFTKTKTKQTNKQTEIILYTVFSFVSVLSNKLTLTISVSQARKVIFIL